MPRHMPPHAALVHCVPKAELGFRFAGGERHFALVKGTARLLVGLLGETSLAHYLLFFHCQKKVSKKGLALRRFPRGIRIGI